MKHILYSLLAALGLLCVTASCSDNKDDIYAPSKQTPFIKLEVTDLTHSTDYNETTQTIAFGPAPTTALVKITSNTQWIAEIDENDGGWCVLSEHEGTNGGEITVTVRDNMRQDRKCYIRFYTVDREGNRPDTSGEAADEIVITQEASAVRLTPSSLEPFPADQENASATEFTITANAVDWTLTVDYEGKDIEHFVMITPGQGMTEVDDVTYTGSTDAVFSLRLQSNRVASARRATLTLSSDVGTYPVEIIQQASAYTFDVSPSETQSITHEGGSIEFTVLSLSKWIIATADIDWVTFSQTSGEASIDPVKVIATFAPNMTDSIRTAELLFKPEADNFNQITVKVVQQAPPYTFSVSPVEPQSVGPERQYLDFGINSLYNWRITTQAPWISFSQVSGGAGEHRIVATIYGNPTAAERNAEINFESDYGVVTVPVTQQAFQMWFHVSDANADHSELESKLVLVHGDTLDFVVNSRFEWEVKTPNWMSVEVGEPNQYGQGQTPVTVFISANNMNTERNGYISFIPSTTSYYGVQLEPAAWGYREVNVSVTQEGGRQPAVSVPWLDDNYTQHEATVLFRYYSPFWPVIRAGIEWRVAGSDDWTGHEAIVPDAHNGLISVELTGLDSATEYQTRGYVDYDDGSREPKRKYGNWTFPFTTAGVYPNPDDNPTPGA